LVGGNLALVQAMAASGRWRPPRGAILALEDVTERPYRIDRMLTALRLGGHLRDLSAIVFGDFEECHAGADGRAVHEVVAERTRRPRARRPRRPRPPSRRSPRRRRPPRATPARSRRPNAPSTTTRTIATSSRTSTASRPMPTATATSASSRPTAP